MGVLMKPKLFSFKKRAGAYKRRILGPSIKQQIARTKRASLENTIKQGASHEKQ